MSPDRLDVARAACAQLGLRPVYWGETETCIVLASFEGQPLKIAATDAPELPSFPPTLSTRELAERQGLRMSALQAALYADCLGSFRR